MTIQQNIPLRDFCNYKIGGNASYFAQVDSVAELKLALEKWNEIKMDLPADIRNIFILGSGTNVLIDDKGFEGLVIKNNITGISLSGDIMTVGSGELMEYLVLEASSMALSGFEWAGGLPGTVGGAIRGNAGAFGGEIKDNLVSVKSINIETLEEKERQNKNLKFGYRDSIFKSGDGRSEIITQASFALKQGDKEEIKTKTQERVDHRISRHPLEFPNIGSTFKNIELKDIPDQYKDEFKAYIKDDPFPIVPVAKILSIAGLKGKRVGGAMISEKHPNFIVNIDHATSFDVKTLIQQVKEDLKSRYGLNLEEEIMYL